MTDATITGIIKWFNKEKGYGFIKPDAGATDVFVHITNLDDDLKAVSKLDDLPVTYQQGESRSRPYAVNVYRAKSVTAPTKQLTKGVVVYFKWENPDNPDNLFGFIAVAGLKRHVPVHVTALAGIPPKQAAQIDKGTPVLFRLEERMHKGKRSWRAFDVQLDTAAALAPSTS